MYLLRWGHQVCFKVHAFPAFLDSETRSMVVYRGLTAESRRQARSSLDTVPAHHVWPLGKHQKAGKVLIARAYLSWIREVDFDAYVATLQNTDCWCPKY
jgi:hypothetical protein